MMNMSSVDVFPANSPKIFKTVNLKENLLMDVPYFIKEHLWINALDEAKREPSDGCSIFH